MLSFSELYTSYISLISERYALNELNIFDIRKVVIDALNERDIAAGPVGNVGSFASPEANTYAEVVLVVRRCVLRGSCGGGARNH